MLHLTGIKYKTDNTNENVTPVDGDKNTVMKALHSEMAYMYAADTLKGLTILIVDDDMNTYLRDQQWKQDDDTVYRFTGVQHKTDGTDINIPLVNLTGINAVQMRYHQEMESMYDSEVLSGCGIKAFRADLTDAVNSTEYKEEV